MTRTEAHGSIWRCGQICLSGRTLNVATTGVSRRNKLVPRESDEIQVRALERRPQARPKDKLPAVGDTVNVKTATYTSNLGSAELLGEWTDPEFDPAANAPYEARVLEIPTPRWPTHWVAKLNLPPNPTVPASEQQRAWTSPVWYTPTAKYSCTT